MPTGTASSFALTLRRVDGWHHADRADLERFLSKHCFKWTFYLEQATEDLQSRHLHGSIHVKSAVRRDNLKRLLCRYLKNWTDDELKNLRRSPKAVGFLYSDWLDSYVVNNPDKPSPGELYLQQEDGTDWPYSTEADKKTFKGFNRNADITKKAKMFMADHGSTAEELSTSIKHKGHSSSRHPLASLVSEWYSLMCMEDIFTIPSNDAKHWSDCKWIATKAKWLAENPQPVSATPPQSDISDSDSEFE